MDGQPTDGESLGTCLFFPKHQRVGHRKVPNRNGFVLNLDEKLAVMNKKLACCTVQVV